MNTVRRSICPQPDDTWATIAARELEGVEDGETSLQSWNLHVFMRPGANAGGAAPANPILPSDIIFVEPPLG